MKIIATVIAMTSPILKTPGASEKHNIIVTYEPSQHYRSRVLTTVNDNI